MVEVQIKLYTRWAPTLPVVSRVITSIYRGYKLQLPIWKAIYRGPITKFITVMGAQIVYIYK